MPPESGQPFKINISLDNELQVNSPQLRLDLKINDYIGQRVAWLSNYLADVDRVDDIKNIIFSIEKLNLNEGTYYITTDLYIDNVRSDFLQNSISFDVVNGDFYGTGRSIPIQESRILLNFNTELVGG